MYGSFKLSHLPDYGEIVRHFGASEISFHCLNIWIFFLSNFLDEITEESLRTLCFFRVNKNKKFSPVFLRLWLIKARVYCWHIEWKKNKVNMSRKNAKNRQKSLFLAQF